MNELSEALNEIILELDTLSNQELQAKFEASKDGLVGAAIIDSEMFLRQQLSDHKQNVQNTIQRLEKYPTDLSCYVSKEESIAATRIKKKFIEILKEELDYEQRRS